jgi:hypothetical protein
MNAYTATTEAARVPVPTEAAILTRLNAGEPYDEGTPLEAAILAHCRATGRDIEWTDARGCMTCFGDVEGRAQ